MAEYVDYGRYKNMRNGLESYSVDELRSLYKLVDRGTKPTLKGELIAALAEKFDGEGSLRMWSMLTDIEKAAVSEVVHSNGFDFDPARFYAKYGASPRDERDEKVSTGYYYNQKLTLLDLFLIKGYLPFDLKGRLASFVPVPIKNQLRHFVVCPEVIKETHEIHNRATGLVDTVTVTIPITTQQTERAVFDDLASLLRLVDAGKVKVSDKTYLPTAATTTEICANLSGGDYYSTPIVVDNTTYDNHEIGPIRAFAWPLLLQTSGLVERSGSKLSLTTAGLDALHNPTAEIVRSIWKKWNASALFDELRRIDEIKGQTGAGKSSLTALTRRRSTIVRGLEDCPTHEWITLREFRRYTFAEKIDVEVTRNAWGLYINSPHYGSLGDGSGAIIANSRYLCCYFFEYLSTLGLIDVGYVPPVFGIADYAELWGAQDLDYLSRYDGLLIFRINALGAYCLGRSKSYTPPVLEHRPLFRVLPDDTVVLTGEGLTPTDRSTIEIYASKVTETSWKIDEQSLLSAIENGNNISKLLDFLFARTSEDVPDSTLELMTDIEERGNQLTDAGPARLIDCRSLAVASSVANSPRTRQYCKLAGTKQLIVLEKNMTAFRKGLRASGFVLPNTGRQTAG